MFPSRSNWFTFIHFTFVSVRGGTLELTSDTIKSCVGSPVFGQRMDRRWACRPFCSQDCLRDIFHCIVSARTFTCHLHLFTFSSILHLQSLHFKRACRNLYWGQGVHWSPTFLDMLPHGFVRTNAVRRGRVDSHQQGLPGFGTFLEVGAGGSSCLPGKQS